MVPERFQIGLRIQAALMIELEEIAKRENKTLGVVTKHTRAVSSKPGTGTRAIFIGGRDLASELVKTSNVAQIVSGVTDLSQFYQREMVVMQRRSVMCAVLS